MAAPKPLDDLGSSSPSAVPKAREQEGGSVSITSPLAGALAERAQKRSGTPNGGGLRGAGLEDLLHGLGFGDRDRERACGDRLQTGIQVGERLGRISAMLEANGRRENEALARELLQVRQQQHQQQQSALESAALSDLREQLLKDIANLRAEVRLLQRELPDRCIREVTATSATWKEELFAELRRERRARELLEDEMHRLVELVASRSQAALEQHAATQKALLLEDREEVAKRQTETLAAVQRELQAQRNTDTEFRNLVEKSQEDLHRVTLGTLETQAQDLRARLLEHGSGVQAQLSELRAHLEEERDSTKSRLAELGESLRTSVDRRLAHLRRETFLMMDDRLAELRRETHSKAMVIENLGRFLEDQATVTGLGAHRVPSPDSLSSRTLAPSNVTLAPDVVSPRSAALLCGSAHGPATAPQILPLSLPMTACTPGIRLSPRGSCGRAASAAPRQTSAAPRNRSLSQQRVSSPQRQEPMVSSPTSLATAAAVTSAAAAAARSVVAAAASAQSPQTQPSLPARDVVVGTAVMAPTPSSAGAVAVAAAMTPRTSSISPPLSWTPLSASTPRQPAVPRRTSLSLGAPKS
eukprot:TRINITY_DN12879_c0_g2_i1.p1 TRINITY_DN12879_c0_g2~~TRINITY_DN12879_c0_g2_i1.p1  ORF type:complete len:633 (-),score=125.89 TRINITY_DN12879_c0_g2_i1:89-1846(-)